jgi:hypothetical protein
LLLAVAQAETEQAVVVEPVVTVPLFLVNLLAVVLVLSLN